MPGSDDVPTDGRFAWTLVREPERGGPVSGLVRGPEGDLWLTGAGGIDRFDGTDWAWETLAPGGHPWEWVRRVAFADDGRVWAGGERLQERVGGTWTERAPLVSPPPTDPTAYDVAVSPGTPPVAWVTEGVDTQFGVSTRLWRVDGSNVVELVNYPMPARPIGLDGPRVAVPIWGVWQGDQWTAGLGGVYTPDGAVFAWDVTPTGHAWAWHTSFDESNGEARIELMRAEVPGDFAPAGPVLNEVIAPAEEGRVVIGARNLGIDAGLYTFASVTAVAADEAGAWFGVLVDWKTGEHEARLARAEAGVEVLDDVLPRAAPVGVVPDGEALVVATADGAVWRGEP